MNMNRLQREEIAKRIGIKLDGKGFIDIPRDVVRIKLDVGLSMSAPHAFRWLSDDAKLFVIGFEPIIENVEILLDKISKAPPELHIPERFLVVPCALGQKNEIRQFYVTSDHGQASFLKPKTFPIEKSGLVDIESLDDFMELIPNCRFDRIDYLKTDCQGFDFEVLLGAKKTIVNTAIITCEMDTNSYYGTKDNAKKIGEFLSSKGFIYMNPLSRKGKAFSKIFGSLVGHSIRYQNRLKRIHKTPKNGSSNVTVIDPTFLNRKFKDLVESGEITANQFN